MSSPLCLLASLAAFLFLASASPGQDEFLEKIARDSAAARPADPLAPPLIPDRAREMEVFKAGQIAEGPFELTDITEEKENVGGALWHAYARRKGDPRQFIYFCTKEPKKTMPFVTIFPDIGLGMDALVEKVVGHSVPGAVMVFHPDLKQPFPDK